MRLRSIVLAALAVLACALVPASAAEAGTSKKRCALPRGADLVAKNSQVVVYTRDGSGLITTTLYGCYRKTGRLHRLAENGDQDELGLVATRFNQVVVSGRYVAWQSITTDTSCKAACPEGYDPDTEEIERADLKTRRKLSFEGGFTANRQIVVSRTGRVAWLQFSVIPGMHEIRIGTSRGQQVIDTGAIDTRSLELDGTTLSWSNAGVAKTATLR